MGGDRRRPRQLHPQRQRARSPRSRCSRACGCSAARSCRPSPTRGRRHAPLPARLDVAAALGDAADVHSRVAAPSWEMPDAQFLQINWEVDDDAALELTPPSLHPSIPPFASFFAGHFPESPVGAVLARAGAPRRARRHPAPRRCASARCATRRRPSTALREHWGYPVQLGEVDVARPPRPGALHRRARRPRRRRPRGAHRRRDQRQRPDDVRQPPPGAPSTTTPQARAGRPGVHDPPGRPRPARPCRCPIPQALGMRGTLQLASPIIGFTFRADTDLVPVRFTIDAVEPAISSDQARRLRSPRGSAWAGSGSGPSMPERWFRQAVIYCLDVDTFQDSNGDGIGDLPGLIDRLDHLARLGVTCIWLNPIHPSPNRDDGYDITDFYARAPRARHARRLRRADPPGRQPRHPGDDRPRRQPHVRRAPVVPVGARQTRTRRTATGTCGRRTSRPTSARAWSSPATRTRRGPSTRPPARGTTTASTTSSPTSTWPTRGCARRSRRSSASGCSSA